MSVSQFYGKKGKSSGVRRRLVLGGDGAPSDVSTLASLGVNVGASTSAGSVVGDTGSDVGHFTSELLGKLKNHHHELLDPSLGGGRNKTNYKKRRVRIKVSEAPFLYIYKEIITST